MVDRPASAYATPLIGRDDELDQIVDWLARGDRSYVIAGPAGAGKSRLASEVAAHLRKRRFVTEHVVATRAVRSIPFGAFAPLLADLNASDQFSLLREAVATIEQRAAGGDLLLVVDDAHLLDDGSTSVLLQLAHARSCSIIATIRTPVTTPHEVTALWKDGLAERTDLAPLTHSAVEQIAKAMLGGPVSETATRWLATVAAGNPMFVRELVIGALADDALVQRDGVWLIRRPFAAPERLAELVAGRLSGLSAAAMDVIDLLAIGEPLPYPVLEELAGRAAIDESELAALLSERHEGGISQAGLSHPLISELRRERMPRARRRQLSRSLVAQFSSAPDTVDVMRVAQWQLDADGPADADLLTSAAIKARAVFDLDLAVKFGQAALAAGAGAAAALAVGEAHFFAGRHDEAEDVLERASRACKTDAERATLAHARSYNIGFLKGDLLAAESILDHAQREVRDPQALSRLQLAESLLHVWSGQADGEVDRLRVLTESESFAVANRARYLIAVQCATSGATTEAIEISRGAAVVAEEADGDDGGHFAHYVGAVLALRAEGRFDEAEALVEEVYAFSGRMGFSERTATFELLHGLLLIDRGQVAEASGRLRDALALNRELRDPGPTRWCLGGLVLTAALSGDRAMTSTALAELDATPRHMMTLLNPDLIDRARAWALVANGQVAKARTDLLAAAQHAAERHLYPAEAFLLHDIVRLGQPDDVGQRLDELCEIIGGQLIGAYALHARAASTDDIGELETAANLFEQLGMILLAAEVGVRVAQRHQELGNNRQATAWRNHVETLRIRLGSAQTPALSQAGTREALTKREHEIAVLAASGATSREIADELTLSVRTVENHLQHVFTKLGVTGRSELVERFVGDAS